LDFSNLVFKVLNVQVPLIFKSVIDSLNVDISSASTVFVIAGSLILGCEQLITPPKITLMRLPVDGAARIGATLFGELLNAVFANIGQRAIRKVARETFEHLLNLDLKFHLSRQTGGLTRAIDRGTKYVDSTVLTLATYLSSEEGLHFCSKRSFSELFPQPLKSPWSAVSW